MAEYYPLLAKAVAGLPNSTPDTRRVVYERARKALLAQLQNLDPPIAEADVARETQALDHAVARLEAEFGGLNGHGGGNAPARPATPPSAPARPTPPSAPARPTPPSAAQRAAPASPPQRPAPPPRTAALSQNAAAAASAAPAPRQPPLSSKPAARPNPATDAPPTGDDRPLRGNGNGHFTEHHARRMPEAHAPHEDEDEAFDESYGSGAPENYHEAQFEDLQRPRAEAPRLYAPQPRAAEEARSNRRLWIVGGIVALVVVAVAVAAFVLRDRPQTLAKSKVPTVASTSAKAGKIADRIGGANSPPSDDSALSPTNIPNPKGEMTAANAPPANPAPVNPAPANPAPANGAAKSPAANPAPANTVAKGNAAGNVIPVAHRAALLVQDPKAPSKVKTYVGTVVWQLTSVSNGNGQTGTAVRADISIPGDKLKAELTLQKNTDKTLPASHTMTIVFTVGAGSPTGAIKQISVPQLRRDDTPTGEPLSGVPVPVMRNSFLVGLTRGPAEATNLALLQNRAWFDIPMLLTNGRIAKLTFEKSTSGTRAINEAIAAWKKQ